MKIAVNIQPLLHANKSGVGFYESEMLKTLLSGGEGNEYFFQYFDIKRNKQDVVRRYKTDNVVIDCCKWFSATLYQLIWCIVPVPYSLFFRSKPDVSVFFNYYLPPLVRGKKVLVVYDTVVNDYPETMRFKTRTMLRLTLGPSIKRADKIVTISQFSKNQIMKHYGVSGDKIEVIPCAADTEKYSPLTGMEKEIEDAKERYGIKGGYFLYLGNLEPRKNITRLIDGYFCAKKKCRELPKLVLSGGKGWLYDDIFRRVGELDLKDDVIFTGYVADPDVPLLMNGALAFCFPSLYEGFGMPPLEAMACGTPVIVSDCSSLPEVVGDCGIKVDPYSVEEIADALIKMCDKDFASEMGKLGLERSRAFSWEVSAGKMKTVFKEIVNE